MSGHDDIAAAERRADLARAHLRAVRRGAVPADGAAIHAAEIELQRALNAAAAAWAAQLVRDGGDAA